MRIFPFYIIVFVFGCMLLSCSYSRKFSNTYYQENDSLFHSIQTRYKSLYEEHPFSLGIKDKSFNQIGFEILTDSIKYVYEFEANEPRLVDTLEKYHFDVNAITGLLNDMQQLHCTWISNVDYYENREKKYLVYISIRHRKLKAFLRPEKYFTLAFFDEKQHYDEKGRLLDNEDQKRFHKINGGLFRRINDRVCYSMSAHFR